MGNVTKLIAAFMPERIKPTLRQARFKLRNKGFKPYVKKNQTVEGVIFDFWIGDSAGQKWYEPQWVQHEMRFIRDYLLQPGDVVLECGLAMDARLLFFRIGLVPKVRLLHSSRFPEMPTSYRRILK